MSTRAAPAPTSVHPPARPSAPKARLRRYARPPEAPDAALSATARRMLDVAERLFAERGLDRVSLREVVAASGQRNLSAAQYHFGTREALVGAVVARRVWFVNELRHQRLDALEAGPQAEDARAVIETSIGTLADVVRDQPWGADYIRIAAQAVFNPELDVVRLVGPAAWSSLERRTQWLRRLLPGLPEATFRERVRLVNDDITYALAGWVKVHGPVTAANRARYESMVRNATDFLAAGMLAPPRAAARRPFRAG
jgi:AcrR family transcriptional regulator